MQSLKNWSLASKVNAVVWILLILLTTLCIHVQTRTSRYSDGMTDQSERGKSTADSISKPAGEEAPFNPRTGIAVRVAASGPTAKQDDHWGECPAFQHYHSMKWEAEEPLDSAYRTVIRDGLCHDDKTDEPIKERPKLSKPRFKPNPKAAWA